MKKQQVQLGGTYVAKVSGRLARVRLDAESRFGGWDATNVETGRHVRIKSAQRLRREVASEAAAEQVAVGTASVDDDRPPQDIDERIAAAPPSVVPYEQRRARAQRAQATADVAPTETPTDLAAPDVAAAADLINQPHCATPGCGRPRAMIHLDRPMCQACWDRHCQEDAPAEAGETNTVSDAALASANDETREQENDMSSKSKKAGKATKKNVNKPAAKAASTKAGPATAGNATTSGAAKVAASKARGTKATASKAKAPKANGPAKPKRVSALDAAAQVLKAASKPMRAGELITAMAEKGLWKSPGGKTPHATLYAAMMREARDKGGESRFKKIDRGQFAFNG